MNIFGIDPIGQQGGTPSWGNEGGFTGQNLSLRLELAVVIG